MLVGQSASQSRLWSVLQAQEDGNLHPHITKVQPCFASSQPETTERPMADLVSERCTVYPSEVDF